MFGVCDEEQANRLINKEEGDCLGAEARES
jgi:hypothetical protein